MIKGARNRSGEEALASRLLLRAIAYASGVEDSSSLELFDGEQVEQDVFAEPDPVAQLLAGAARSVTIAPDGRRAADAPVRGVLVSGSFNPLHVGHERLAHAAAEALGLPASFELPVLNADKPPLGYAELEQRLDQFRGRYRVVLSREPLFVGKAAVFPSCVFAIGQDTAKRLIDPRYYDGAAGHDAALEVIRANGCRFLVAGRVEDGVFRTLADIAVPDAFRDLFVELPERAFRIDLASSEIRAWRAAGQLT
jgi:hypothetical protein